MYWLTIGPHCILCTGTQRTASIVSLIRHPGMQSMQSHGVAWEKHTIPARGDLALPQAVLGPP
jgi:hypothetical protein